MSEASRGKKRPTDANRLAKSVVDELTGQTPAEPSPVSTRSVAGAVKGGEARAEKLTGEQRSEIARKAAAARWNRGRSDLP